MLDHDWRYLEAFPQNILGRMHKNSYMECIIRIHTWKQTICNATSFYLFQLVGMILPSLDCQVFIELQWPLHLVSESALLALTQEFEFAWVGGIHRNLSESGVSVSVSVSASPSASASANASAYVSTYDSASISAYASVNASACVSDSAYASRVPLPVSV